MWVGANLSFLGWGESCLTGKSGDTHSSAETAVEARDSVANVLTADQRAEAQRRAREWDEAHPRNPPSPLSRPLL